MLENTLGEIGDAMKQGAYYGMQTFHQALVALISSGEITLETALAVSSNPEEVMMAVRGVQTGSENSSSFFPRT
jgi:twitching motility protein PilT